VSAGAATPAPTVPLLREAFAPPREWEPLAHEVVNPAEEEAVAWVCGLLTTGQADLDTQDEADLSLLPTLTRTWMRRGEQLKLRAPGSPNAKRSVSAATDLGEGATLGIAPREARIALYLIGVAAWAVTGLSSIFAATVVVAASLATLTVIQRVAHLASAFNDIKKG